MIDDSQAYVRRGWGRLRRFAGAAGLLGLGLIVVTVYAGTPADAAARAAADRGPAGGAVATVGNPGGAVPSAAGGEEGAADLDAIANRVERVTGAWAGLATYYDEEVAPIERVLLRFSRDTALVEHIAVALVREANRIEMEPRLLLAVLLVENPWLDPDIRSPVGAIGLMQVMPVHRGGWPSCGLDLEDIDVNICHGARIFAHYFRTSRRDIDRALLRYNGCVRGTNTPNCHQYPNHVFAHAGRASVMAWLEQGPTAGSP